MKKGEWIMKKDDWILDGDNPLRLLNDPERDDNDGHPYYQADAQDIYGKAYNVEWDAHWEGDSIWDSSAVVADWKIFVVTEVKKAAQKEG